MVWTGEAGKTSEPAQLYDTQEEQTPHVISPSAEPRTPEAERRQLTVMFCDLADSTQLSSQLDPEDLREVIRAYQQTSAGVIQRFEGYIGLPWRWPAGLFRLPQAHEDDAQRAVRAGLGVLVAIETLNPRVERERGI